MCSSSRIKLFSYSELKHYLLPDTYISHVVGHGPGFSRCLERIYPVTMSLPSYTLKKKKKVSFSTLKGFSGYYYKGSMLVLVLLTFHVPPWNDHRTNTSHLLTGSNLSSSRLWCVSNPLYLVNTEHILRWEYSSVWCLGGAREPTGSSYRQVKNMWP